MVDEPVFEKFHQLKRDILLTLLKLLPELNYLGNQLAVNYLMLLLLRIVVFSKEFFLILKVTSAIVNQITESPPHNLLCRYGIHLRVEFVDQINKFFVLAIYGVNSHP
jgi:hypothetical protein